MPILQDVRDSLSRKEYRANLSALSDRATMGTVDFDYETASSSFSNTSLLAEAGSSVCGSSVNNVSPVQMTKQTSISHMRNVSDTAVFGDETPTSEKEPHPWTSEDSGLYTGPALSYQISTLEHSTTTHSFSSPHSFAGNIIGSHDSEHIDAPARSSQADKVSDREVLFKCLSSPTNSDETCVQSSNHVSHDQMQTVADRYERDGKLVPADSTTRSRDLSPTSDNNPCAPGVVVAPPRASGAHKLDQHHRCCIGVLSSLEEKYLNDEDKKAILEGGCHGLCTAQATFSGKRSPGRKASRSNSAKSSQPARGLYGRPARYLSPMPSDIMPNGCRGEKSTLPRFSRRRVAAEYKRTRSHLGLVEHPSRPPDRCSALPLAKCQFQKQTNLSSVRKAIRDSKPGTVFDPRLNPPCPSHYRQMFSSTHQPKQKLKRQSKHGNLRQIYESQVQLAREISEAVQEQEPLESVATKEKNSSTRKLFRRVRALFLNIKRDLMVGSNDMKI